MFNRCKNFFGIQDNRLTLMVLIALIGMFLGGCFSIFVRQPMNGFDEAAHYGRSIQVAHGEFMVLEDDDWSQIGGNLSQSQYEFIERARTNNTQGGEYPAVQFNWLKNYTDLKYTTETIFYTNTNAIPYTPFVYLPYTVTFWVTEMLKLPPGIEFFIMRLVGLIFFSIIWCLAVKVIPFGKLTLSLIGIGPSLLMGFSTITADGYTIAFSALFFAVVLKIAYKMIYLKKKIATIDLIEIASVSLALVLGKMPLFVFVGLILPLIIIGMKSKLMKNSQMISLLVLIVGCAMITLFWLYIVRNVNTGAFFLRDVSTERQLNFIFSDITNFTKLLISTIANYNLFKFQLAYTNFGYYFSYIPTNITFLYVATLIFSSFINDSEVVETIINNNTKYFSIFSFFKNLLSISFVFLVFIILYLQFSTVGSEVIEGVQERYFIPIYIILLSFLPKINLLKGKLLYYVTGLAFTPLITYVFFALYQMK